MPLLTVELIPRSTFGKNLRSLLTREEWDRLRKKAYEKAKFHCEICGEDRKGLGLECHEVWKYNDRKHTQTLKKLVALCTLCHMVKHYGYSIMQYGQDIKETLQYHIAKVNNWTLYKVGDHITDAFDKQMKRNRSTYTLNTTKAKELLND